MNVFQNKDAPVIKPSDLTEVFKRFMSFELLIPVEVFDEVARYTNADSQPQMRFESARVTLDLHEVVAFYECSPALQAGITQPDPSMGDLKVYTSVELKNGRAYVLNIAYDHFSHLWSNVINGNFEHLLQPAYLDLSADGPAVC